MLPTRSASFVDPLPCATVDPILKVLRPASRRFLLCCLSNGESDVTALAKAAQLDLSYVSSALSDFFECGLVARRREKLHHFYSLSPDMIAMRSKDMLHIELVARNGERLILDLRVSG